MKLTEPGRGNREAHSRGNVCVLGQSRECASSLGWWVSAAVCGIVLFVTSMGPVVHAVRERVEVIARGRSFEDRRGEIRGGRTCSLSIRFGRRGHWAVWPDRAYCASAWTLTPQHELRDLRELDVSTSTSVSACSLTCTEALQARSARGYTLLLSRVSAMNGYRPVLASSGSVLLHLPLPTKGR